MIFGGSGRIEWYFQDCILHVAQHTVGRTACSVRFVASLGEGATEEERHKASLKVSGVSLLANHRGEVQTSFCAGGIGLVYYQCEGPKMLATIDFEEALEAVKLFLSFAEKASVAFV